MFEILVLNKFQIKVNQSVIRMFLTRTTPGRFDRQIYNLLEKYCVK